MMTETTIEEAAPPKKKRSLLKLMLLALLPLLLIGGGVGGGLYAAQAGWLPGAGGAAPAARDDRPQLVPKSEQAHAEAGGSGEENTGTPTPAGEGGEAYASNYYALEKEFTSNLQNSVHFVQAGLAISTHYDDRVIQNLRTHEIAVRSAVLMALSETTEEEVFTTEGKRQLEARLVNAINGVLQEKEGFGGIGNVYFTNFIVQ